MAISTTKMSSKGQVVIPGDLRKKLNLKEGAHFVVLGEKDTIVLKRVAQPSTSDIRELLDYAAAKAKKAGLTKADVARAIKAARKSR
jgi:AbrB family looped-hinge helix DNA binding protein